MARTTSGSIQSGPGAISERVVTEVAAACDVAPRELPPLYDRVDPDALDRLFDGDVSEWRAGPGRVVFTIAGCEVVVHSTGDVEVTAPEERSPGAHPTDRIHERNEAERANE